jgi:hypothetical protein
VPASARSPRVLAIDAGAFVVGKAQTTPDDESAGLMESAEDALSQRDSSPQDSFPKIVSGIYRHVGEARCSVRSVWASSSVTGSSASVTSS